MTEKFQKPPKPNQPIKQTNKQNNPTQLTLNPVKAQARLTEKEVGICLQISDTRE